MPPEIEAAVAAEITRRQTDPFWNFQPLPSSEGQHAFVNATWHARGGIFTFIGGNRTGKSESGAYVAARHIKLVLPNKPKKQRRFWVIGEKYEMTGAIMWGEKLSKYIDSL